MRIFILTPALHLQKITMHYQINSVPTSYAGTMLRPGFEPGTFYVEASALTTEPYPLFVIS